MMKKTTALVFALLLTLISALPLAAQDDEVEVSISFDASILNKYIWRGIPLTDGPVFQPSATVGIGGLSLNAWMNVDLDDVNGNEYEPNEIDLVGEYAFSLDQISIAVGFIHYSFPNTDFDSTFEVYGSVSVESPLNPSVTLYKDMDLVEGMYLSFGVSESLPLEDTPHSMDFSATLGYGDEDHNLFYYGAAESGMTDLLLAGSFNFVVCEKLTIIPQVMFSMLMEDAIKDNFEDDSHFVFGVGASYSF
jgi:hypothetical protein